MLNTCRARPLATQFATRTLSTPICSIGVFTGYTVSPYYRAGKYNYTARRERLRNIWFPDLDTRRFLEREMGVVIRWVVGRQPPRSVLAASVLQAATLAGRTIGGDAFAGTGIDIDAYEDVDTGGAGLEAPLYLDIEQEEDAFGGFLRLPSFQENYGRLAGKTKAFAAEVARRWAPDFVLKVDDDVLLRIDRVLDALRAWDKAKGPMVPLNLIGNVNKTAARRSTIQAIPTDGQSSSPTGPGVSISGPSDAASSPSPSPSAALNPVGDYIGCMKQGPVISDPRYRYRCSANPSPTWLRSRSSSRALIRILPKTEATIRCVCSDFEKFRWFEPAFPLLGASYPTHAWGSAYLLRGDLARDIALLPQLREFVNEDVSMGLWALALNAEFEHDDRFCVTAADACPAAFNGSELGGYGVPLPPPARGAPNMSSQWLVAFDYPRCAGFCDNIVSLAKAQEVGGPAGCLGPRGLAEWTAWHRKKEQAAKAKRAERIARRMALRKEHNAAEMRMPEVH